MQKPWQQNHLIKQIIPAAENSWDDSTCTGNNNWWYRGIRDEHTEHLMAVWRFIHDYLSLPFYAQNVQLIIYCTTNKNS